MSSVLTARQAHLDRASVEPGRLRRHLREPLGTRVQLVAHQRRRYEAIGPGAEKTLRGLLTDADRSGSQIRGIFQQLRREVVVLVVNVRVPLIREFVGAVARRAYDVPLHPLVHVRRRMQPGEPLPSTQSRSSELRHRQHRLHRRSGKPLTVRLAEPARLVVGLTG